MLNLLGVYSANRVSEQRQLLPHHCVWACVFKQKQRLCICLYWAGSGVITCCVQAVSIHALRTHIHTHQHMSVAFAGLLSDPCCSSTAHAIQTPDDMQRCVCTCVHMCMCVWVWARGSRVSDTPLAVSEGSERRQGPHTGVHSYLQQNTTQISRQKVCVWRFWVCEY